MTYYHNCKNCAVDKAKCVRRAELKAALKGLSVTSVKFACPDRKQLFQRGDRVAFSWSHWDFKRLDDYGEAIEDVLSFRATVVREVRTKFVLRVDQDAVPSTLDDVFYEPSAVFKNGGRAIKMMPQKLTLLDEPSRNICADCLVYEGEEEHLWACAGGDA